MDKDTFPPVIDLGYLGLITEGDRAMEKMMFQAFLRSAAETAGDLRRSCETPGQDEAWRIAAHKLAGSAAQIGAIRLHLACAAAETAKGAPCDEKQKMAENIRYLLSTFKEFIDTRHKLPFD